MISRSLLLFFVFLLFSVTGTHAQSDSLLVKNNQYLIGEIKSMERGVLVIETPYSKSDFRVKWGEILAIYSERLFITSSKSSNRIYGKISSPETGFLKIISIAKDEYIFPVADILYIKSVNRGFLDRLSASVDFGFTLTRARNQRQFSARSHLGYIAQKWSFDAAFNKLVTAQDEIEDINRGDGNLTAIYFPRRNWFALNRLEYLYNTEQALDLRFNTLFGAGRDFFKSNTLYWRVFGGLAFNNENFSGESMDRRSAEAWVASELNIFDMGDVSLLSNIFVYPSLTEKDRVRIDYRLDLKYDMPLDFYIKTGMTLNYDNQPFQSSRSVDYIWQTTLGWSW
ncbi:DUF481 domain-containing protein [Cyclobacterium plantarum]|uniref:DUF481 domain-containing protein n=1 Tax=Cyclobacterium plantarum TaxID=2716263 RepID=A0ABX0H958_9BACT|nr:DUF481 domain-containing protein [Cyclobacterium plantarum]NHE56913.1 DUF481 domain-containing protein [Cyclobacterium plantarum]